MATHSYSIADHKNIETNRKGKLSSKQREALEQELKSRSQLIWFTSITWAGIILAVLAGGWLIGTNIADLFGFTVVLIGGAIATEAAIVVFSRSVSSRSIARDMKENNIVSADGNVVWKANIFEGKYGYIALTKDKRQLKSPFGNLHLLPGKYHFYFLRRGGCLLSAEKISQEVASPILPDTSISDHILPEERPNPETSDLLNALIQAFGFSIEDMEANRRGILTDEQCSRLHSEMITEGVIGDMIDAVTKFGIIGVAILWIITFLLSWDYTIGAFISLFYLAIVMVLSARKSYRAYLPLRSDLAEKRVESADGIKKGSKNVEYQDIYEDTSGEQRVQTNTRTIYFIVVPKTKQRFYVSMMGYNALVLEGNINYRVYYIPHDKRLVSIEPVRVAQDQDTESNDQ